MSLDKILQKERKEKDGKEFKCWVGKPDQSFFVVGHRWDGFREGKKKSPLLRLKKPS
jgi:hypothetical protein